MSRAVNRTTKSGDLEEYSNGRHLKAHKRHFKSSNKKKWLSGTFKVFVFFSIGILLYFLTFIRSLSYLNDLEESISWALHAIHIRGGTPEKTSENIPVKWTYNEAECKPPDWTVEEKVGNVSLGCDEIEKLREEGWKKIGEGYWRDVFLAEWKGKPIVVKYMKEKHKKNERNLDRHQREAITLGILHRSKNVVKLVGYCDYHVATEWMPLNLEEVIFSPRILPYKHVLQIAMGIARSLRDVHKIAGGPVVHADIQPRQFMIDYDGHIKINDLNRCRYMQHDNAGEACPFQIKSHNGRWRSPEEYTEGALLTEKIDIYSVGLIFWSLLSRKLPYNDIRNDEEQQLFVIEGGRPPIDLSWPKEFVKLIKNCWDPEPSNRPQAQTVLNKATKFYEEYSKSQASEDGYELQKAKQNMYGGYPVRNMNGGYQRQPIKANDKAHSILPPNPMLAAAPTPAPAWSLPQDKKEPIAAEETLEVFLQRLHLEQFTPQIKALGASVREDLIYFDESEWRELEGIMQKPRVKRLRHEVSKIVIY